MSLISCIPFAICPFRRTMAVTLVGLCIAGTPVTVKAELPPPGLANLVETLLPAVVNITTRSFVRQSTSGLNASASSPPNSAIPQEMRSNTALGSGFVIDPDGVIVTNNHVIEGAFDVSVTFQDGTTAHAEVMGTTKIGDIALLKVNMHRKLPAVHFGDSMHLRVGDPVVAIGNPLGFGGSVTTGIVSALNRDIMISPFDEFIQTDASINHGNSGGPLFNLAGEVIGVNTALYTPTDAGGSIGIGFAIPSFCVQFVVNQLRQFGYVRAGDVGVKLQDVTGEIAHAAGLPLTARTSNIQPGSAGWGVIVTNVTPDGAAAQAGLQDGDILTRIDNDPVGDTRGFARQIAIHPLDQKVAISFWRNGAMSVATPVVREWFSGELTDKAALASSKVTRPSSLDLGLQLAALTPDTRLSHNLPADLTGVLITGVMPDSVGGDRGLGEGDVILKVVSAPVSTPAEVLSRLRDMVAKDQKMMLVLVRGNSGLRWVPLPIESPVTVTPATLKN